MAGPILAGGLGTTLPIFLLFDLLAMGLWAGGFTLLGMIFAHDVERALGALDRFSLWGFLLAAAVLVVGVVVSRWKKIRAAFARQTLAESATAGHGRARWIEASMRSMRRWRRPPSNAVPSHSSRIASRSPSAMKRSPSASTFESLCARPACAESTLQATVARMPRTRLATMASPLPDPPSTIPRSHSRRATASATARMIGG